MRIGACHLCRCFDAGCTSSSNDNLAASCLDGWQCFAQRYCGQRSSCRQGVGVLRHTRDRLSVSLTSQCIDQVVVLHLLRLLLILDHDLAVYGIETSDSSLNKLDVRSTQYLWKRAPLDCLIGGKLM